jgi:hypothetical protein
VPEPGDSVAPVPAAEETVELRPRHVVEEEEVDLVRVLVLHRPPGEAAGLEQVGVEPDLAAVRLEEPDEVLDEHGFSSAGRADDEEHLAVSHVEGHTLEDGLRAERLLEVAKRNHRRLYDAS